MKQPRNILLIALVVFGTFTRMIPHPQNFTPILAIALFAGARFGNREFAFGIPIGAMFAGDLFFIFSRILPAHGLSLLGEMVFVNLAVYSSMAIVVAIGIRLQERLKPLSLLAAALVSSGVFFLITNLAVWVAFYDNSWVGLLACYANAIPYFKNTLASTVLYSGLLFGALMLAEARFPVVRSTGARSKVLQPG